MRCRVRAEDLYWRLACRQASWLPGPLCRLSGTMALRAALGDPHRFAQGLAWRILEAGNRLQTARMFAALAVLGLLGAVLHAALEALEKAGLRWWRGR